MATVSRSTKVNGTTTLASNTLARAADVETDMLTLFTSHNNHDAGTSKWTVVSAEGATNVPLLVSNSTGTQAIAQFNDNATTVLTVADGGTTTVTANGGTNKALIVNNGTSTGNILEAQDNGSAVLTVADGGNVTVTGKLLGPDGTAALPTYSFSSANSNDNGLYLAGTDNPAISAGGTKRLDVSTTTITAALPIAMGSNKITGLAAATANGDAVRYEQNKVIQYLYTSDNSSSALTGTIPEDDTIPQIGEGNQIVAQTVTPTTTGNYIDVSCVVPYSVVSTGTVCLALFETDVFSASNAMAVSFMRSIAGTGYTISLRFRYTTTSTAQHTFRLRIGNSTGNIWLNSGNATAREYGGVSVATMTVTEVKA